MKSTELLLRRTAVVMATATALAVPAAAQAKPAQHAKAVKVIQTHAKAMTKHVPTALGAVPRIESTASSCRSVRVKRGLVRSANCRFSLTVSDIRGTTTVGRRICGDTSVLLRLAKRSRKLAVVKRTSKLDCRSLAVPPAVATPPAQTPKPVDSPATETPAPEPFGPAPGGPPSGGPEITPPTGAPTGPPPGFTGTTQGAGTMARLAWVNPSERPATGFAGCTGWFVDPWYKRYYMFECAWVKSSAAPGVLFGNFTADLHYYEGWYYGVDGRAHFWYAGRP